MATGRTFASRCSARAALAGNPSDGYGGAVVAIPIDDLAAVASTAAATTFGTDATNPDLKRLLIASADTFESHTGISPQVTLSGSTTIPRSVGLGGSSALVISALRALGAWVDYRWGTLELAEVALAVEQDHLGIAAGLQDRLVQSTGKPTAMTFAPVSFEVLEPSSDTLFFIAWASDAADSSDTVHRSIRRRFDSGDPDVHRAMILLAEQASRARTAIHTDNRALLADSMNRSFELRTGIVDVGDAQRELVDTGRSVGAAVNSAGSGGSIVGLAADTTQLARAQTAYERSGADFLAIL